MDRRSFLGRLGFVFVGGAVGAAGCRDKQYAHVLNEGDRNLVGSHTAGAETWEPLVQESVTKLLGRQHLDQVQQASGASPRIAGRKRICFVGVENHSAEEIGDFRDQIYQKVDLGINGSGEFEVINRRFVEAGLRECRLRPEDLFIPNNRRSFLAALEKMDQGFEYLLFATITSGTTSSNQKNAQRDYLFTLELVDIESGHTDKEAAQLSKGYHKSKLGAVKTYGHT